MNDMMTNGNEKTETAIGKISQTVEEMPGLTVSWAARWLPLIQFIVVLLGILVSFCTALYKKNVNVYLPFISETGAYSPEMCIFSLTLILGSFLGCVFMIFRYLIVAEHPMTDRRNFLKLNKATLIVGLISMFGLSGVAAFPMTTVFWAHLLVAGVYFVGSSAYMVLSTIMTYNMNGEKSYMYKFRLMLSLFIIVFQLMLIIIFPVAMVNWREEHKIIAALKTPDDKGFTLLLVASCLEWIIVGIIVSYHLSFLYEMRNYKLCLKAKVYHYDPTVREFAEGPVLPV